MNPKSQREGEIEKILDKLDNFILDEVQPYTIRTPDVEKLKAFLHKELSALIEEERKSIKNRIGFLRQWLNEKDKDRLVTNRDIEVWLELENLQKKI